MVLSDISIRRPVLATVMSVMVVLVGLLAYNRLSVREYPNIDEPVVSVETTYRGASAEVIEAQVTQIIEESLSGIEGIDIMTSISRAETSQITVRFRLGVNVSDAASDVRDRVGRVRNRMPDEIDEPVIAKVEADAQPIIYLAFASDRHSAIDVTDYADRFVKDRLQTLPGVAEVRIFGAREFAMRIWLDKARMAAYGVTAQDVESALRHQNIEVPSGRIESVDREFTVTTATDLRQPEQFANIVLRDAGGYLVRLGDVGRAEIDAKDKRIVARFQGRPAVALGIIKQSVANPLDVSRAVNEALPRIEAMLPQGMRVASAYDTAIFIDRSIKNVYRTIVEATTLVILVIFLFLGSLRATLIPLVTIPVSLIGAFIFMAALGFTINTLTLLAMVLAIGLVVDDAIVMLENIHRHVEAGLTPFQAALKGSREIGFAIVAMTLTLAAVYAPVGFQTGRTGRLFGEFALTLAGAVLVSGFVALSLSPMMSSLLLTRESGHGAIARTIERALDALARAYRRALEFTLTVRAAVVLAMILVGGAGGFLLTLLKSELSPVEDRGVLIGIGIGPEGATVDHTDGYARRLEAIYAENPDIDVFFMVVGFPVVTQAISFMRLHDWDDRTKKQQQVAGELAPKMFGGVPGLMSFPINPPSLGQSPIEKPIQFVLLTSAPYPELQAALDKLVEKARSNPGLTNIDSDLRLNKPEIRVSVDRDAAANMGVEIEAIGRTLETMLGGRQVTRFRREGKQYDVMVQVDQVGRANPSDLTAIYVRARTGAMVPLDSLVKVVETVAPRELNHFNKLRAATLTATLAPGYALGEALQYLSEAASEVLPAGVSFDYAGESREFRSASSGLAVTFLLALVFIYLVLAAQFESFIDPFVIMLTVPLSMTGALLALNLTDGTLNVYSQIGLITLIGLITKHGILIVEFANQLQEQGRSKREAVVEAAQLRLRPILMTTGAMVLGAIPLAIASGAGAESRQQIGWVIVGGMSLGTLFTLFVVPTAYTLIGRTRRRHAEAPAVTPAPAE